MEVCENIPQAPQNAKFPYPPLSLVGLILLERDVHGINIGGILLTLQPSQPLLRVLNFSNTRVSVFPEVEESARFLAGYRTFILSYKDRTFPEQRVFPADPEANSFSRFAWSTRIP